MIVSCIGTVTAFLVVNAGRFVPGYALGAWLFPTVVGVPLLVMWRRKYDEKPEPV